MKDRVPALREEGRALAAGAAKDLLVVAPSVFVTTNGFDAALANKALASWGRAKGGFAEDAGPLLADLGAVLARQEESDHTAIVTLPLAGGGETLVVVLPSGWETEEQTVRGRTGFWDPTVGVQSGLSERAFVGVGRALMARAVLGEAEASADDAGEETLLARHRLLAQGDAYAVLRDIQEHGTPAYGHHVVKERALQALLGDDPTVWTGRAVAAATALGVMLARSGELQDMAPTGVLALAGEAIEGNSLSAEELAKTAALRGGLDLANQPRAAWRAQAALWAAGEGAPAHMAAQALAAIADLTKDRRAQTPEERVSGQIAHLRGLAPFEGNRRMIQRRAESLFEHLIDRGEAMAEGADGDTARLLRAAMRGAGLALEGLRGQAEQDKEKRAPAGADAR